MEGIVEGQESLLLLTGWLAGAAEYVGGRVKDWEERREKRELGRKGEIFLKIKETVYIKSFLYADR